MAGGESNTTTGKDAVELEAMRKGSFSWHPCQVSLCSSGSGLIVKYEDSHSQEVIADKEEILSRVRVRSTPLQGDDCSSLEQGYHVLAQSLLSRNVFYDARVEKAVRVRHSKRTLCRCSFTVKWLNQSIGDETLTVPATGVMKLSTKSINLHPTISTFFSMLKSINDVEDSMCLKIVDDMNWEKDINVLLEKQIEELSNATDAHVKISRDIVYGFAGDFSQSIFLNQLHVNFCIFQNLDVDNLHGCAADVKEPTHDESLKEPNVTISLPSNLKVLPVSVSPIQESPTGNRLPLNPLAARAALASLRSNFPKSTDAKVLAMSMDTSPNIESIAKTLFPAPSAPQARVTRSKKKNMFPEKDTSRPSETRLTRSRTQENNRADESCEINGENGVDSAENKKKMKLTRSRTQKNNGADESWETNGENSVDFAENNKGLSGKDEMIANVKHEKVVIFAEDDAEKHNCRKRITRSAAREETTKGNVRPESKLGKSIFSELNEEDVFKGNCSTEIKKVNITPKNEDGVTGNSKCTRQKFVSATKQQTRSSPRLKLLPRTHS
ncbi:carboxyl-terminal domain (ctd) phosphatase-like2 [Striga asiatica]|uniref:Carboxyl-terminal domain (Ctd) phosphatase-like2 n=1 Tax=Striga asiatica TaxID=4170 RepID=A0A5A7P6T6_STRAF|nr:carboxyl-terminal domain (ctd) phosphatase-like2 [Striga asiatica]